MKVRLAAFLVSVSVSLGLWAGSASTAQEGDIVARGRAHFEIGRAQFDAGNYPEAIREFEAGYALSKQPVFLIDLAQVYRKLNDLPKAKEYYRTYLENAPKGDPARSSVAAMIAEIDAALAVSMPPREPPPPALLQAEAQPSPLVVAAPPPRHRRRWVWPLVGVTTGVVIAGVAITLALVLPANYAARERASCTQGCILVDGTK